MRLTTSSTAILSSTSGRCIEGGVFDEKSSVSDANGYRKDVFDATKKLQVSLLRGPVGTSPPAITGRMGLDLVTNGPRVWSWPGVPPRAIALARTSF